MFFLNRRRRSVFSWTLNSCNKATRLFLATALLGSAINSVNAQSISPANSGLIGIDLDGNGVIDVPTGVTLDAQPVLTGDQDSQLAPVLLNITRPSSPDGLINSTIVYTSTTLDSLAILEERVSTIDKGFTRDYQDYSDLSGTALLSEGETSEVSLAQIRQELIAIVESTGTKPAVIYAVFYPSEASLSNGQISYFPQPNDELELILVSATGETIRKRIKGATRIQVTETANRFSDTIFYGLPAEDYLPPAQQLSQWLVEPLKEDLEAMGIENLVFILDSGIRSLPLAALHDGEQYLIENYSVGMMPSFQLTDTKYQDIRDVELLAMGADNFTDPELSPLPAVSTELDIIAQNLWDGESFLNDEFTIANLQQIQTNQPFGILHLATHAEFLPGEPSNSFIQFGDRKLGLNEMRDLGLDNPLVQLIVLSACKTAVGDRDAEYGFASLAYQAGVKSALGSLWYVSDSGTLSLMSKFYRELKDSPIKAEALRRAQLSLLRGEVRLENGKLIGADFEFEVPPEVVAQGLDLTHPQFWSAFAIIGNPW